MSGDVLEREIASAVEEVEGAALVEGMPPEVLGQEEGSVVRVRVVVSYPEPVSDVAHRLRDAVVRHAGSLSRRVGGVEVLVEDVRRVEVRGAS